MYPVNLIIIGAGSRGSSFARFAAEHPDLARVVGVAEPRSFYRQRVADQLRFTKNPFTFSPILCPFPHVPQIWVSFSPNFWGAASQRP